MDLLINENRIMAYLRVFSDCPKFIENKLNNPKKTFVVDVVFISKEVYKEVVKNGFNEHDWRTRHPNLDLYYEQKHGERIKIEPGSIIIE